MIVGSSPVAVTIRRISKKLSSGKKSQFSDWCINKVDLIMYAMI